LFDEKAIDIWNPAGIGFFVKRWIHLIYAWTASFQSPGLDTGHVKGVLPRCARQNDRMTGIRLSVQNVASIFPSAPYAIISAGGD
jgi:hypothetical protein